MPSQIAVVTVPIGHIYATIALFDRLNQWTGGRRIDVTTSDVLLAIATAG